MHLLGQIGLKVKSNQVMIAEMEVPVVVDAGIGSLPTREHEMGAILVNTAIATADDPIKMGEAVGSKCRQIRLSIWYGRYGTTRLHHL